MRRTKPAGAYEGRESSFQASAIKLVRAIAGQHVLVIHCPNGRNAGSVRMGGFWRGQGVVSGVPDILVFQQRIGVANPSLGLALELKVWPNKPTIEQLIVHDQLSIAEWRVHVCYGLGEVELVTKEYFRK